MDHISNLFPAPDNLVQLPDSSAIPSGQNVIVKPFLKWAGNKHRLLPHILPLLPGGGIYIEPFAGSAAVFLNVECDDYRISDINPDVIHTYNALKENGDEFIKYTKSLFSKKNNSSKNYYDLRDEFNDLQGGFERSAIFVYLNRHGYNGLCRYNASGEFNVPFGRYKQPRFPENEMIAFSRKAQRARFSTKSFTQALARVPKHAKIYVDPPYLPEANVATFTGYFGAGFGLTEHKRLAELCKAAAAEKSATVVLSNHDNEAIRSLYEGAEFKSVLVRRTISCLGARREIARELLARF